MAGVWTASGRASFESHLRAGISVVSLLLATPACPENRPGPDAIIACGEVLAVGVEDGTLLLDGDRGLELLVIHPDAAIRDFRRTALTLARIRPGDFVEYTTPLTTGLGLVSRLVVTPVRPWANQATSLLRAVSEYPGGTERRP
jgi:hypothetical protein